MVWKMIESEVEVACFHFIDSLNVDKYIDLVLEKQDFKY